MYGRSTSQITPGKGNSTEHIQTKNSGGSNSETADACRKRCKLLAPIRCSGTRLPMEVKAIQNVDTIIMGEGKFFVIQSQLNGMVLEVSNGHCAPGNPVVTMHQSGGPQQLWYEDGINHVIRSGFMDDYCLEMQGSTLVVNEFHPDNANQKWMIQGDRVCNVDNPSMVFDVADCCQDPGARICAWDFNGGPNQLWSIEYQPPRYCFIRSKMHGKVLDVRGGNPEPGTKVIVYDQNESMDDNQLWYEDRYGAIHSKLNDFVIDMQDGKGRLMPYDPSSMTQAFAKNGDVISNKNEEAAVFDIKGGSSSNDTPIITYEYNGQDNQKWSFDYL